MFFFKESNKLVKVFATIFFLLICLLFVSFIKEENQFSPFSKFEMVTTKLKSLEHLLLRFDLPKDLFKVDKSKLKFTIKLSLLYDKVY